MITVAKNVLCTSKPDAKAWQNNGLSGISYRVGVSDGKSSVEMKCATDLPYNKFEVGQHYDVAMEVTQVAQNNYIIERVRIVDCQLVVD